MVVLTGVWERAHPRSIALHVHLTLRDRPYARPFLDAFLEGETRSLSRRVKVVA